MMWLKQSTAVTVKIGPFVDSTDGNTQETALTISQADIRLSKNGGAFAQSNNIAGATHDANGWYGVPLDTTDTNTLGTLTVFVHETGALAVWRDFMIVPTNVWDSLFGADALQVHANEITAGLITAAAIATGAIDADALATDAVAEIADGVWDEPKAGHVGVTTFGDLATDLDTVVVDVAGLDGAAMRGTDSAALASVCTEARLSNLDAAISTRATPAQVNTEVDTALADVNLDHLVGTAVAIPAIPAGTYIDQMMDDGTAIFDRTTDSLQAIRDTAPLGTAMRGTDSAALASVCTEARLAELDAANLPTDVAAVKTDTAAILVDTGTTLDGRIPAALVAGRIDASVGAMATGVVTADAVAANAIGASELAADAVAEIADGVWDELKAGHVGATTFGDLATDLD